YPSAATLRVLAFPTRRSSDLVPAHGGDVLQRAGQMVHRLRPEQRRHVTGRPTHAVDHAVAVGGLIRVAGVVLVVADLSGNPVGAFGERLRGTQRSEEHTSELQSRENLVCRLLLEKK